MRGTAPQRHDRKSSIRITPACAGNSQPPPLSEAAYGDHPRVCGEQLTSLSYRLECIGSPPRVRGTGHQRERQAPGHRITPACAGNSLWYLEEQKRLQDHPRVCGEQASVKKETSRVLGSPPRVRGTGGGNLDDRRRGGITPACAGNSSAMDIKCTGLEDHPRVCGEQRYIVGRRSRPAGSPPRVRGTGESSAAIMSSTGITPACAGNSI